MTALVRQAGQYLGYALTNLLHLYNPDVIMVGAREWIRKLKQ
ncbi:hypothetical protein AB4Z17_06725 [Paenibacillus sp. TAF43_2]